MANLRKFSYTARDLSGTVKNGMLTAPDESAAAKRLQAMGLAPLSIKAQTQAKDRKTLIPKRVKAKHIASFCRQFATMSDAGLPIVRSLAAFAAQTDHPEFQRVLPLIRADIEKGSSFASALSKHPEIFPPLLTGMVAAGESSGTLSETMNRIAENYEKEAKLRSKIFSSMLYPVAVLALAAVMITGMLVFIVPTFVDVFANLGGELPLPTKILVLLSEAVKILIIPIIIGAIAGIWWWRKNKNTTPLRQKIDPVLLRIPIFGKFIQKIILARFCRTLGGLLSAGVPVLQSLDMVSNTTGNQVVSKALMNIKEAVSTGRSLSNPMMQENVFPPMVAQMVATGEETGDVPRMLVKVADYYDVEIDATAEALTSILEPILIVGLALIVGGMVVAMYMPMFAVFDLVQ